MEHSILSDILPQAMPQWLRLLVLVPLTFACAAGLSLLLGRFVIAWLLKQGVQDGENKKASELLAELKEGKAKTPTMGGLFFILSTIVVGALVLPLSWNAGWIVLIAMIANAGLGVVDDWIKLTKSDGDGIRPKTKLVFQFAVFSLASFALVALLPPANRVLWIPGLSVSIHLGWFLVPFGAVVGVATSNATNLADGLDGLAGGMGVMTLVLFAFAGVASSIPGVREFLSLPQVEGSAETSLVCIALAGSLMGFLWYNMHPAQVFMGDTGSLALGSLLGMAAIALRMELLLLLVAAPFVAEALSVVLQVGYFKLSGGKRIFLCSPLHHHFQFKGMPETRVVSRFWLATAACCLLGGLVLLAPATVEPTSDKPTMADESPDPSLLAPDNAEVRLDE